MSTTLIDCLVREMPRSIEKLLTYLLEIIRATWPLVYAVIVASLVHFAVQRLKVRQQAQEAAQKAEQKLEPQRPVVFDEKQRRFRRFETGDEIFVSLEGEFVNDDEVEQREEELVGVESDSGHASFSTDSVCYAEPSASHSPIQALSLQLMNSMQFVEESTRELLLESEEEKSMSFGGFWKGCREARRSFEQF